MTIGLVDAASTLQPNGCGLHIRTGLGMPRRPASLWAVRPRHRAAALIIASLEASPLIGPLVEAAVGQQGCLNFLACSPGRSADRLKVAQRTNANTSVFAPTEEQSGNAPSVVWPLGQAEMPGRNQLNAHGVRPRYGRGKWKRIPIATAQPNSRLGAGKRRVLALSTTTAQEPFWSVARQMISRWQRR